MKALYSCRIAWPQVAVAIQRLAAQVSKWSAECDRRLDRPVDYMASNGNLVLAGSLGEHDLDAIELVLWPDADLNGDEFHTKSTSGCFLELAGAEGRSMPMAWGARKQPKVRTTRRKRKW